MEDGSKITLRELGSRLEEERVKIKTPIGYREAKNFRYTGRKKKCRFKLKDGREVVCSPDHKFKVRREGNEIWLPLKEIKKADYIITD